VQSENICAFLDAYCTPTDGTSYLELRNLGKLKGLKEIMDANGRKRDAQLPDTVHGCLMLDHTWKQPPAMQVRHPAGKRSCTQISDPIKSSFRRRRTSGFAVAKLGDFGLNASESGRPGYRI
jgi:hypothetical protein